MRCRFVISLMALLLLASCGHTTIDSPIDAIPDGVTRVVAINLNDIAEAYGDRINDATGNMTPAAESAIATIMPAPMMRAIAAVLPTGAVDPECAVLYTNTKRYSALILKVTDEETLTDKLSGFRDPAEDFSDYKTYTIGHRLVAIGNSLCIIAPDAETIKPAGQGKSNDNIAKTSFLRDFLERDDAVRVVASGSAIYGSKMKGKWIRAAARFTEHALNTRLEILNSDGTTDSIGSRIAGQIDPDALKFVPQGASVVIASGLQGSDAKLFGIEDLISNYFPGDVAMSRTGTTLFYGRPAGSLNTDNILSPSVWNLASVTAMSAEDGDQAIKRLQNYTDGFAILDPETTCYTYTRDDQTLTYGYTDGYFLQGLNGGFTFGNNSDYSSLFHRACIAGVIDIPAGSELQKAAGLPCGASLEVKLTTTLLTAKLTLYGNKQPVLATLNGIEYLHGALPLLIFANE